MVSMLLDVFEEHLSEAAFLWSQWEQALRAPDYNLDETAGAEARLRAHLDGLLVGEEPVAGALLRPALEAEDPAECFAAAFTLLSSFSHEEARQLLASLTSRPPELRAPIQRALELLERADLAEILRPLLTGSDMGLRALALEVLSFHAVIPEQAVAVDVLLEQDEERLLVAALRCLWPLPAQLVHSHLPRLLADSRSAVRDAAMEAGLLSGAHVAWEQCLEGRERGVAPSRHQMLLLALSGERSGTDWLIRLLEVAGLRPDVLWALGFSGQVAAADACVQWMHQREVAPLAGESFSAITGLQLEGAYVLDPEESFAELPALEEDDLDADLTPRPEDSLPCPKADAVGAWWHQVRGGFTQNQRYLRGRLLSPEALLHELAQGPMRRRHVHALDLALRTRGACRLQTRAFTDRQHHEMTRLRETLSPVLTRPLSRLSGSW